MDQQDIKKLAELIGADKVLSTPEELAIYAIDASKIKSVPGVIVLPSSKEDVLKIVNYARQTRIPVYPRGAGSGMTGGAVPGQDGILMVFSTMNRILNIDPINMTAEVEPGVVTAHLNKEAEKQRLYYPPDPASAEFSTIGGNLAECAGGLRAVKYGVTRDYVLQLEVVTMAGEVLTFGAPTLKSVTGYDVCRLLVGSEGTLAIITKAIVKLIPKPETKNTVLVTFDDDETPITAALNVLQQRIIPCAMEYIGTEALRCAYEYTKENIIEKARGALLLEFDGNSHIVERDLRAASEIIRLTRPRDLFIGTSESQIADLWEIRKCLSPAIYKVAPSKLNEDICVQRNTMLQMVRESKAIAANHKVKLVTFAHVGDGNFHFNFMYDEKDEEETERVEKAVRATFAKAIELGGTLSGEHGIGLKKKAFMSLEYKFEEIEMFRKIKKIWDPDNLLNPGKMF